MYSITYIDIPDAVDTTYTLICFKHVRNPVRQSVIHKVLASEVTDNN